MSKSSDRQSDAAGPGADVYHQRFSVAFDYPVHFTRKVFDSENDLLARMVNRLGENRVHRAAVYVDSGLHEAQGDLVAKIKEYFHRHPSELELAGTPQVVPGGEAAKNGWQVVEEVMSTLGNLHLDRQSYVIAVGGGAMLDMMGFATSLVHRGLRLIRVPTTVLGQNDAGVGVKNGMDEHGMKNFVGTFAPPFAVLNDFEFLTTLADRDWVGGLAEAFKVAIIKDAEFLDFLCQNASALRLRDTKLMEQAVRRCAILHLEHTRTSGDPFEFGSARPLDFGHWAGHKIETMSNYSTGHGQGAAVGIALDSVYAMRRGLISTGDLERILAGLSDCGLPICSQYLSRRTADGELEILAGLEEFREHLGGRLNITLPHGLGDRCEVHHVDTNLVAEAIEFLSRRPEATG